MSVRVRVSFAAPTSARLRQAAAAGLLLASAALAGCTAGAVLTPIPPVDVGTHTAAIAEPAPMMRSAPIVERQPSVATSEMGYPAPQRSLGRSVEEDS